MTTNEIRHGVRQGDVVLVARAEQPAIDGRSIGRDARGRIVLQEGESTGHAHAVLDETAEYVETGTVAGAERWLRAGLASQVVHEEHSSHALEAGLLYEQWYQYEYSPAELRRVAD